MVITYGAPTYNSPRKYKVTVNGSSPYPKYATFRNAAQLLVVGSIPSGSSVLITDYAVPTGQSGGEYRTWYLASSPSVRGGTACGWFEDLHLNLNSLDGSVGSAMKCGGTSYPAPGAFAQRFNCKRILNGAKTLECNHGTPATLDWTTNPDATMPVCANVGLTATGQTSPVPSGARCPEGAEIRNGLHAGRCVNWRYITQDGKWALVSLGAGFPSGDGRWAFVPIQAWSSPQRLKYYRESRGTCR